jgi:GNAT superfamily N-acetyltransferase
VQVRVLDCSRSADVELGQTLVTEYVSATFAESEASGEPVPRALTAELFPECFDFAAVYGAPGWAFLVVADDGHDLGGVGLRRHDVDTAEMKRMWVRPEHRGRGAGRRLAEALLDHVRSLGYRRVILDVLPRRSGAITLYESLGFIESEPVHHHPFSMRNFALDV